MTDGWPVLHMVVRLVGGDRSIEIGLFNLIGHFDRFRYNFLNCRILYALDVVQSDTKSWII